MNQKTCLACGAVLRAPPKKPGICPYCGDEIETGLNRFELAEPPPEDPQEVLARRRRHRKWGWVEVAVGSVLFAGVCAVFISGNVGAGSARSGGPYLEGLVSLFLVAHGLLRVIFGASVKIVDDDFHFGPKD